MKTEINNTGPPRRRATRPPGKEAGIGADFARLTPRHFTTSGPPSQRSDVAMSASTEALDTLPLFLVELLNNCPKQGSGVHQWLFGAACHLRVHFDEDTIVELLLEKAQHSGRPPERLAREVRSQVKSALFYMWLPSWPDRWALRYERVTAFSALVRRSK